MKCFLVFCAVVLLPCQGLQCCNNTKSTDGKGFSQVRTPDLAEEISVCLWVNPEHDEVYDIVNFTDKDNTSTLYISTREVVFAKQKVADLTDKIFNESNNTHICVTWNSSEGLSTYVNAVLVSNSILDQETSLSEPKTNNTDSEPNSADLKTSNTDSEPNSEDSKTSNTDSGTSNTDSETSNTGSGTSNSERSSRDVENKTALSFNGLWSIGGSKSDNKGLVGSLCGVTLWSTALTGSDVKSLYEKQQTDSLQYESGAKTETPNSETVTTAPSPAYSWHNFTHHNYTSINDTFCPSEKGHGIRLGSLDPVASKFVILFLVIIGVVIGFAGLFMCSEREIAIKRAQKRLKEEENYSIDNVSTHSVT